MRPQQGPAAAAGCAAGGGLRRAAAGLALAVLMGGTAPPQAAAAPPALPAFAARAALEPAPGADGLQRVALPLAVLQQLQTADRRDLRVLNGAGEPVPMAWAGEPVLPPAEPAAGRPLPLFVWPADGSTSRAPATASVAGDAEVRVELGADGAVVRVQRRGAAAAPSPPATPAQAGTAARPGPAASTGPGADTPPGASDWLLDLGPPGRQGSHPPVPAALLLHWTSPHEGLVRRVQLLASADAQHWAPAGSGTLLDLPARNGGAPVQQRRLALPPLPEGQRYLRLQADAPLALTRAEAVAAAAVPAPALEEARFKPTRSGPRSWTLDSGAVLPVLRLQLHLPQDNAVWPLALAHRPSPAEGQPGADANAWQALPGTTAYRLLRGGERVESPPLALGAQPARHWRLTLDERIAAPEAGPELTLAWAAPQLLFATRGAGPFSLVFGAADAPAATLARSELLPGYRPGDEFALPQARLGPVQQQPVQQRSALQRLVADLASRPQQAVLWLSLALAVGVLALLAWRLARELKAAPGSR